MPELRLLSYNIRSLRDDKVSVAAVIRACRPDIVAVQEAPRFFRWRSKRAALARTSGLVVGTADREGGLMLMTSLAVDVDATGFALLPKAPKLHQRAVSWADVSLRGARWTIASIHFSLSRDERPTHLPHVLGALGVDEATGARPGRPVVIAGDVNEKPDAPTFQRLAATLQDSYAVAPDGPGETYRSDRPHKRIDGVFADRRIEVVSCHAVHELTGGEALDASGGAVTSDAEVTRKPRADGGPGSDVLTRASDHLPVLTVLRQ
jgi:endonuclease/exonuclease/phosphatase family metal-dependent hydrolase